MRVSRSPGLCERLSTGLKANYEAAVQLCERILEDSKGWVGSLSRSLVLCVSVSYSEREV